MKALVDTNIFYACVGTKNKDILQNEFTEVYTSISCPLEIAAEMNSTDRFEKRKFALQAVKELTNDWEHVFTDDPDKWIANSFNVRIDGIDFDRVIQGFELILKANSSSEAERGIINIKNEVVKFNFDYLRKWDDDAGKFFQTELKRTSVDAFEEFLRQQNLSNIEIAEKGEWKKAWRKQISESALTTEAKEHVLYGMLARIDDGAAAYLREAYVENSTQKIEALRKYVRDNYNNNLDYFINIYQKYYSHLSLNGFTPALNDANDIFLTIYMNNDLKYLTNDEKWAKIVHECYKGKSIYWTDLLNDRIRYW